MNLTDYWNSSQLENTKITFPSQYAQKIEPLFQKRSKILDIGGARGNDAIFFNSKGHETTIIDISTVAKELSNQRESKINYFVQDISKTPYQFPDRQFDAVYSRLTLQYFIPSEMINIFKEIKRLLTKSGRAYIAVKSDLDIDEMNSMNKTSEKIEEGVYKSEGIIKARYSEWQIKDFLKEANIEKYKITEISEELEKPNKYGNTKLQMKEIIIYN